MKRLIIVLLILTNAVFLSCAQNESDPEIPEPKQFKILALGDSYTIGEAVCESCNFPTQLQDSLASLFPEGDMFSLDIIAQTGWTSAQLLTAVNSADLATDYDIVTLLIGVNNQFQGLPFNTFQNEFHDLLLAATVLADGNTDRIIVLSIPDYAETPFGEIFDDGNISDEIDLYNSYIESTSEQLNITFLNITDISRMVVNSPELLAEDGLHLSKRAYSKFVERILPIALEILDFEDN